MADCPYCGAGDVAFSIAHEHQVLRNRGRLWDTFATCGRCRRGVVASFDTAHSNGPVAHWKDGQALEVILLGIFPSRPNSQAPDHTPPNVARFYVQGVDNLPENWDAAGSMFRKALEAALKNKFPEIEGTLYDRIEEAAKEGGLTPDLAKWSHQIRLDGRNAVHEEKPYEKEDAERATHLHPFGLALCLHPARHVEEARGEAEEETGADLEPSP